mmetsp:Transcript_20624/g.61677  ORF Transcript_20624/g.61677 Transcript_20624/m.61677 type:complete len:99 (+) Transcript_20624:525-821(+)
MKLSLALLLGSAAAFTAPRQAAAPRTVVRSDVEGKIDAVASAAATTMDEKMKTTAGSAPPAGGGGAAVPDASVDSLIKEIQDEASKLAAEIQAETSKV